MINGNLSPVFTYSTEIHGTVCGFLDEVTLTRVGGLSQAWNLLVREEIDPAWRNLYEKIWAEPLRTTPFYPSAYRAFQVRYKCVKLHLLYRNSLKTVPHVVHHTEKIRKIPAQDYFNALLIERHREAVLSTSSLYHLSQISFLANLNALPLDNGDKRRWYRAFMSYEQYSSILLQFNAAKSFFKRHYEQSSPICQSSIFREAGRYVVIEIGKLADPRTLTNPDTSVVDSCLSHTSELNYLYSEAHLIMWRAFFPDRFEEKSTELLFEAANSGALEILGALLQERDCSVKEKEGEGEKGWTALHYLSRHSDKDIAPSRIVLWKEIANKLLEIGCSPLQRGDNKNSPITLAMREGNVYLMECFFNYLQKLEITRESEEWRLLLESIEEDRRGLLEAQTQWITISEEDKQTLLSRAWSQLIEVIEEDEKELLSDSQIEIIGMAFKYGFCADIRENQQFIYKLLIRNEWELLPLFFNYCSSAQIEEMQFLVFEWAAADCACEDDDTYSELLLNLECFLEIAQSRHFDFNKVDLEGKTCLHRCITFFEDEIESIEESLYEDEYEENDGEDMLKMFQQSYLNCVRILLENQNISQANSQTNHGLLDLVRSKGDVYSLLLESMNPSKRRALN